MSDDTMNIPKDPHDDRSITFIGGPVDGRLSAAPWPVADIHVPMCQGSEVIGGLPAFRWEIHEYRSESCRDIVDRIVRWHGVCDRYYVAVSPDGRVERLPDDDA